MSFDFAKQCVVCSLALTARQLNTKQISQIENTNICALMSKCLVNGQIDLHDRLQIAIGNNAKVSYHKSCYKKLTKTLTTHVPDNSFTPQHSPPHCSVSTLTTADIDDVSSQAVSVFNTTATRHPTTPHCSASLPLWDVAYCGPTRSHHDYLLAVARSKGMVILPTRSDGHCFYQSVEFGLRQLGIFLDIYELRAKTADRLMIDRDIFAPMYEIEELNAEVQTAQAPTFDAYVAGTRTGNEWAIEMCVASLAKALNVSIRVVSTLDGDNGFPTAIVRDYADGVTCREFITVGFNKATKHYVAFGRGPVIPVPPLQLTCEVEPMDWVDAGTPSTTRRDIVIDDLCQSMASPMIYDHPGTSTNNITAAINQTNFFFSNFADATTLSTTRPDPAVDGLCQSLASIIESNAAINADVNADNCSNCRRRNTAIFTLPLFRCEGPFIKRQYCTLSSADLKGTLVLCGECRTFLTATPCADKDMWSHSWPSVITYLLIKSTVRAALWSYLPSSWRCSLVDVGKQLSLASCDDGVCQFADYTEDVRLFDARTTSGHIRDFITAMDTTCFPSVKCPAGCFAFFDECGAVPFNHFIAWRFGLCIHKGHSKFFTGARSDWPSTSVQLDTFRVNPGLIVNDHGLCVLMCRSHGDGLFKPFIHVPIHPILKDEGLHYPDATAAAVLQPNVIRKGRMGTWTNSNHVVQAVGGYSGISSSSISLKLDTTIIDERLAMATCLSMSHRPDTANIVRNRMSVLDNVNEELERLWYGYHLMKPTEADITSCLHGGTFVNSYDAFLFNKAVNMGDTEQLAPVVDGRPSKPINLAKLITVVVHPNDEYGRKPVPLFNTSKTDVQLSNVAHLLGNVIAHCPSMLNVLLGTAVVRSSDSFVVKLAKFANRRLCTDSFYTDQFAGFVRVTTVELQRRHIDCHTASEAVCKLLAFISPSSVFVKRVKSTMRRLLVPDDDVQCILLHRDTSRVTDVLPVLFNKYHLIGVFGKNEFAFRWNADMQFWKVVCAAKRHAASTVDRVASGTCLRDVLPRWSMAVYVREVDNDLIDVSLTSDMGCQRFIRCADHGLFLVKQPVATDLVCNVRRCSKKCRWRCLANGDVCVTGVCLSHGRQYIQTGQVVDVRVDVDDADTFEASADSSSDDDADRDVHEPADIGLPIGNETSFEYNDLPATHSRQDIIPVYDVGKRLSGHYLWNHGYGVMSRKKDFTSDIRTNAVLQHIVAVSGNASVSMLFPEGQLFPRIFYAARNNSVVGALPSFMLNSSCCTGRFLAPAAEHYTVRMKDGDLLTCKESIYWHYVFDIALNTKLQNASSVLVFRRGFEHLLEKENLKPGECVKQFSRMPMDEFESVRRVKELASLLKKGDWSYFLTLTINETFTPGVRRISQTVKDFARGDIDKLSQLTDSFLPFTLRAWERFVRFFLQELIIRNPNIVGEVRHLFYRYEFQGAGAKGNKPHVHAGITLAPEPTHVSTSRICCSSREFHSSMHGTDFDTLHQLGVVQDESDYDTWCDVVASVNHHDCSKTQGRCMKATNANGDKVCRYHRQPPLPTMGGNGAWFTPVVLPYPDEAYVLLREMGLARHQEASLMEPERWILDDALAAGKWHYPSASDEFFLASIPLVSAITRSSTNVEMCDRHFQVSYLVKYIAGKEEHQLVDVAGSKNIKEVTVTTEEHGHEKIASCSRLVHQKELNKPHAGREVSLAEVVWFVLGFPYTYCTADFVHVPTLPVENRAAVLLKHHHSCHFVNSDDNSIVPIELRVAAQLPEWRRFTAMQEAHCTEYRDSAYCIDVTSAFNIRPPELLVFDDLQLYNECFTVTKVVKCDISEDVASQQWIDGASRLVKLRSCSVLKAIAFLTDKSTGGNFRADILLRDIFLPIQQGSVVLIKLFVSEHNATEVVSVISAVKPWDRVKFLFHLCLSIGRYTTEFDLFRAGTMKLAATEAGLLPDVDVVTRPHILTILRRYVLTDLAYHPISARQFARYMTAAMDTLQALLIDDVVGGYTPCMSEVTLKEQATAQVTLLEQTRRQRLVDGLLDDPAIRDQLMDVDLTDATLSLRSAWVPHIQPVALLTDDALAEQSIALTHCVHAVDQFIDPQCRGVRFPCLVGRPGSGKSHVLKLACAYALSKGLQCELISWTSHRSRALGGRHLHLCFPLPVKQGLVCVADSLATDCLRSLDRDPMQKAVLARTDVFLFEEIGLLSAEHFCALDTVLRSIMRNSLTWGGKLVICCGDSKQLPPISGRPIWSSANMSTIMAVVLFKADVRALDANLRWINNMCRNDLDAAQTAGVADAILRHCSSAVSWDDVPADAVRIVPTKAAERTVIDNFLATQDTRDFDAIDEVLVGSVWSPANERISQRLNRECYEYARCRLYLHALVCMTYNERRQAVSFSQGQLAVVIQLPDGDVEFVNCRVLLKLAPPGVNGFDVNALPEDWPVISVRPRTTAHVVVGPRYQMGRRTQFPIRFHMTSTIHRIQGETVSLYATQLCDANRQYRLWQKEQLAVLLSRARYCRDIIFVGDRTETREALQRVLAMSSKWDMLVQDYLSALDVMCRPIVRQVRWELHPFLPMYRELPTSACGYVYLLASIPFPLLCYIGHCDDLKQALRQHNTGYGADETRSTALHPWGVFAFVCGFAQDDENLGRNSRLAFYDEWRQGIVCNRRPEAVYQHGLDIVTEWMGRADYGLVIVKCADVR